jgi:16S rRNA (guanine966-N2)-methyltransferase
MRIIAGKCKGMTLKANFEIRPTLDRVKVTLFNILQFSIEDTHVLDLFSGNGSLGIEALSRGAKHCLFIERSRQNLAIIEENLKKTRLASQATVLLGDAFLFDFPQKYDLIFIDPPFRYHTENPELPALLERSVAALTPEGILAIEHPKEIVIAPHLPQKKRTKNFHHTAITLIYKEDIAEEESDTQEESEEEVHTEVEDISKEEKSE